MVKVAPKKPQKNNKFWHIIGVYGSPVPTQYPSKEKQTLQLIDMMLDNKTKRKFLIDDQNYEGIIYYSENGSFSHPKYAYNVYMRGNSFYRADYYNPQSRNTPYLLNAQTGKQLKKMRRVQKGFKVYYVDY